GTLAYTDAMHFLSWRENLERYNLDIDLEFFNQYISGKSNPQIVTSILPNLSSEEGKQLIEQKEADYRKFIADKIEPLPGLKEFLTWAQSLNIQLGLVTNAPRENANLVISALDLSDTFAVIILGEDLPFSKPDPLPYQKALSELGVSNSEAIAFEDSPSGILSAVSAGITTVGVLSGHPSSTLTEVGAKWVIQDFRDSSLERLGYFPSSGKVC
ncbi:HAD family phosphatase, partial [Gloeocapsa sp. PCC 73106]|uniref:HAD family hydrolase n=1 Tax=Gloeocapsa sp. PCC 73106 TaxID=102232 RepID=UPI0002ABF25C